MSNERIEKLNAAKEQMIEAIKNFERVTEELSEGNDGFTKEGEEYGLVVAMVVPEMNGENEYSTVRAFQGNKAITGHALDGFEVVEELVQENTINDFINDFITDEDLT